MSDLLTVDRLGKRYGRTWALRNCSFALLRGRIAALVGSNGAGKTTLLSLAVGLLRPSEGSCRVMDWSPSDDPEFALPHIGFMVQDAPLHGSFSVAEMLRFGRSLNRRWDQAGSEQRLARLGIPLTRRVRQLSGGQRAQLGLTLALAKRPALLLLDEPLGSLDPRARRAFLNELVTAAHDDDLTVIFSSHVIGDLERACDHLLLLDHGRLVIDGGIDDLLCEHRLLWGPSLLADGEWPDLKVVHRADDGNLTRLWVRGSQPALPAGWQAAELSLEDLVLTYLEAAALEIPDVALGTVGT